MTPLYEVTRTIYEYLDGGYQEELSHAAGNDNITSTRRLSQQHQQPRMPVHRQLDLLISQLRGIYADNQSGPPQEMDQRGGGRLAAFARAMMMLFHCLMEKTHREIGAMERMTLMAACETTCSMGRDGAFQYLLLRGWEDIGEPFSSLGTLQSFLLTCYCQWQQGKDGGAPLEEAVFFKLWSILTAQQPLEIQSMAFPTLAEALFKPIQEAAATEKSTRRGAGRGRGGSGSGAGGASSILLYSLQSVGQALRSSPSFRKYVRDLNAEEKNGISDALLSLVVSMQEQDSGTEIVLASLGALVRLVAGDTAFESQVFERRNVEQMAHLVFTRIIRCLLPSSFSSRAGGGESSPSKTVPFARDSRGGGRKLFTSSSSSDLLQSTDGEVVDDLNLAKGAADVLSDMLRSPIILTLLERDIPHLPRFIQRAVSLLASGITADLGADAQQTSLIGRGGIAYYAKYEPLLRALRLVCTESFVFQTLFVKSLLSAQPDHAALARFVELVVCPHAPTAWEAVGLLECLLEEENNQTKASPSSSTSIACAAAASRSGKQEGDQAKRLWLSLAAVMKAPPAEGSALGLEVERTDPLGLSPPRMRLRGSSGREVSSFHAYQPESHEPLEEEEEEPVRMRQGGGEKASLMEHLIAKLQLLAEELEVANGLGTSERGNPSDMRSSSACEAEWSLRSLLAMASLLCQWRELATDFSLKLSEPRPIGAIILGLAHLQAKKCTDRLQSERLTTTKAYVLTFAPTAVFTSVGSVDIVVMGCIILFRTLVGLNTSVMMHKASNKATTASPLPPPPAARDSHSSSSSSNAVALSTASEMEEAINHYNRWISALMEASQVVNMIYIAATQGTSRALAERALELLTLAQSRGGANWEGIVKSFFHNGQNRGACMEELMRRFEEAENQVEDMRNELAMTTARLSEEEVRRNSMRERHENEMRGVEASLIEEIKTLRESLKQKEILHEEKVKEQDHQRLELEEKLANAQSMGHDERVRREMAEREIGSLRQQLESMKSILNKMKRDSASCDLVVRTSQHEVESLRQSLIDKDMQRIEAESRLDEAMKNISAVEATLEENYYKLIALAEAYKSKEDTAKRNEARLQQLEAQVIAMQAEVEHLREALQEKGAQASKLQNAIDRRDLDISRLQQDLSETTEELSRLKIAVEGKEEEVERLGREGRDLREVVRRREGQLEEKEETLREYKSLAAMINRLTRGGTPPMGGMEGLAGAGSSSSLPLGGEEDERR